jgi:hypothetical protein
MPFSISEDLSFGYINALDVDRYDLYSELDETIYIEKEDYSLLKFGRKDISIFRDSIIEIVKGYRHD